MELSWFKCAGLQLSQGKPELGPYISKYEVLDYAPGPVSAGHARHKRAVSHGHRAQQPLQLGFSAHGRQFSLELVADHSVFHPEYRGTGPGDSALQADHATLYQGELAEEPGSSVFGTVRDGVSVSALHCIAPNVRP